MYSMCNKTDFSLVQKEVQEVSTTNNQAEAAEAVPNSGQKLYIDWLCFYRIDKGSTGQKLDQEKNNKANRLKVGYLFICWTAGSIDQKLELHGLKIRLTNQKDKSINYSADYISDQQVKS